MPSGEKQVRVSRGPRLQPQPHPDSFDLDDILQYASGTDRPLAIDLFCCAGGLSLGLEEAGFRIVLGVDNDELALETHRSYFGGVSLYADLSDEQDISTIGDALEDMDISLVAGSPPCQPFSRAGESKIRSLVKDGSRTGEDERRELWRGFVSLVERVNPRCGIDGECPRSGFRRELDRISTDCGVAGGVGIRCPYSRSHIVALWGYLSIVDGCFS